MTFVDIQIERAIHREQAIIKLLFDYDVDIIAKIRSVQGARWSRSMHCWYVADLPQKIEALQNLGIKIEKKNVSNIAANDNSKLLST